MTDKEIVQALRCCSSVTIACDECNAKCDDDGLVSCHDALRLAAADLIERLEKEKAALMEYAKKSAGCEQCANYRPRCEAVDCYQCAEDCPCLKCKRGSAWRWKGLEGLPG